MSKFLEKWIIGSFIFFLIIEPRKTPALMPGRTSRLGVAKFWRPVLFYDLNQSYLLYNRRLSPTKIEFLSDYKILELKQQLEDINRDYDLHRSFGLIPIEMERAHSQQVFEFTKGVLHQIEGYQIQTGREKIQFAAKEILRNPSFQLITETFGVIAAAMAIYFGKPFDIKLNNDTQLYAWVRFPSSGRVEFRSSIVSGALELNDSVLGTSVSKEVSPHILCALDSNLKTFEEVFRIFYSFRF